MSKANVLLIGMGAVGTIAAYALDKRGQSKVTCVVRSVYDILTTRGFDIESVDYGNVKGYRPDYVEKSVKEAMAKHGPFDYVLVTMKNIPDIHPIEPLLAECYSPDTAIVLLQNGIGIERPVFKEFPEAYVISGVTMIGTTLYHDTVKQVGPDLVTFGPFLNPRLPEDKQVAKCKKFVDMYTNPHNQVSYDWNVKYTRWKKLVYNATVNTTCALTNVDLGRLELFGGVDSVVRPAMREVLAIAKADGVELPESIIEYMIRSDDADYYPPSMLMDVRKGNYTEYRTLIGNVLMIAKEHEIYAPTLTVLSNLLHVVQMRTMEEKGRFELPKQRPLPADNYKIEYKD
ncbi:DEKNAAC104987 [Brettanomyces naardenensis]|uniref:2-dehydropantoate 2-reductase n=1 Tax=Brettanomyces naardenensis TaxID=13370 RepID=A0A448YS71_BRENA|nr:DEKNAAC104987 [Brettanomyces naardenensis]